MSSQLAQLVRELAGVSDNSGTQNDNHEDFDHIAYTIKTIFQSGQEDVFTEHLNQFIERKEQEIEKMCNFHYQEFVQSVDQLLKVRMGSANLKTKIVELNKEMQEAGTKLIEKKSEIIENRRMLLNVEHSLEALQTCIFVLDIANKVNVQIEAKKYYSALRLLDDLEKEHLPTIAQYSFCERMHANIPIKKETIKQAVTTELKDWFFTVQANTRRVGKAAFEAAAVRQEALKAAMESGKSGGSRSLDILMLEDNADGTPYTAELKIDFKPLYQCIHIYELLGKKKELKAEYEMNRQLQANLFIKADFSFTNEDMKGFETSLLDMIGYFLVDSVVMNTTNDFRSKSTVETLWDIATEQVDVAVRNGLAECENPDLFLNIKLAIVHCIHSLEGYGYPVNGLTTLMLSLFDRYTDLTKQRCCEKLYTIVEEDEYAPMAVPDKESYERVIKVFHIEEDKKTTQRFPRALPFSKGFIECCDQIRSFIIGFYSFAEGFEQQHHEMDDLLKKSLENLLIQNLANVIGRKLGNSNISQAVQIIVNLEYFELACHEFEELLVEKRYSRKGRAVLQAKQTFKDMKQVAEKRIFDLIHDKIDEFLELSDYNWLPSGKQARPSGFLQDLVDYLTSIVTSTLVNLPPSTKNFIYFDAFNHLVSKLMDLIVNKSEKRINLQFIDNMDVDVMFLESYVSAIEGVDFGDTFLELRQMIAFFKSENFEDYLNPTIRSKKFSRIRPQYLATLLEKLKQNEPFLSSKAPLNKNINALLPALKKLLKP